jgi:hypothetical protein
MGEGGEGRAEKQERGGKAEIEAKREGRAVRRRGEDSAGR